MNHMTPMYSFFFAAGVAGFAYMKLGRRVGYGNSKEVWTIVGICFGLSWVLFYSFATFVLHI
jgi:hypothetical protein